MRLSLTEGSRIADRARGAEVAPEREAIALPRQPQQAGPTRQLPCLDGQLLQVIFPEPGLETLPLLGLQVTVVASQ
jgi:hypothetical protein